MLKNNLHASHRRCFNASWRKKKEFLKSAILKIINSHFYIFWHSNIKCMTYQYYDLPMETSSTHSPSLWSMRMWPVSLTSAAGKDAMPVENVGISSKWSYASSSSTLSISMIRLLPERTTCLERSAGSVYPREVYPPTDCAYPVKSTLVPRFRDADSFDIIQVISTKSKFWFLIFSFKTNLTARFLFTPN